MSGYDWNATMGGSGLGAGPFGGLFNTRHGIPASLPAPVAAMPTAAALNWWALPNQANPVPVGGTPGPEAGGGGGGFMNFLRGKENVPGDGALGWLGKAENLSAAMQGIGALTGAWQGFQQLRLAKDQLNFQRDAWQKNFGNSVRSYNTRLEDRIRGRTAYYTGKENDVQAYLDRHKLG